jgi:hypothetical protein
MIIGDHHAHSRGHRVLGYNSVNRRAHSLLADARPQWIRRIQRLQYSPNASISLHSSQARGATPNSLPERRDGTRSHCMRLPGFGRKHGASQVTAGTAESRVAADDDLIVRLIVITADEDFYLRLQQIAGTSDWRIGRALSTDEAETLISAKPTPIVVYDSDSDGGNWRGALRSLNGLPTRPCVLLASRVADDYLLQEVVRNHGYDLLPKSAPSEKVIHRLEFAWFWARAKVNREDSSRSI